MDDFSIEDVWVEVLLFNQQGVPVRRRALAGAEEWNDWLENVIENWDRWLRAFEARYTVKVLLRDEVLGSLTTLPNIARNTDQLHDLLSQAYCRRATQVIRYVATERDARMWLDTIDEDAFFWKFLEQLSFTAQWCDYDFLVEASRERMFELAERYVDQLKNKAHPKKKRPWHYRSVFSDYRLAAGWPSSEPIFTTVSKSSAH